LIWKNQLILLFKVIVVVDLASHCILVENFYKKMWWHVRCTQENCVHALHTFIFFPWQERRTNMKMEGQGVHIPLMEMFTSLYHIWGHHSLTFCPLALIYIYIGIRTSRSSSSSSPFIHYIYIVQNLKYV
jgi:hypothetical protein